jgi:hypothetical protein
LQWFSEKISYHFVRGAVDDLNVLFFDAVGDEEVVLLLARPLFSIRIALWLS